MDEVVRLFEPPPPTKNLIERLKEFASLTRRIRELDAESRRLKALKKEQTQTLYQEMTDAELGSVSIGDETIYQRQQMYVSIKKGRADDAHRWLRILGLGDLIQPTVNSRCLSVVLREMARENGDGAIPEEFFTVSYVNNINVRKK